MPYICVEFLTIFTVQLILEQGQDEGALNLWVIQNPCVILASPLVLIHKVSSIPACSTASIDSTNHRLCSL